MTEAVVRRVKFECIKCGSATDAFPGTDRLAAGTCRDCTEKREDRRPRELNDLSGKEWAQLSKSVQEFPDTRSEKQRLHGAAFPRSLAKQQISIYTRAGQTVLDPFVGVGTTLDACEELGRIGVGVELNEKYRELAEADLPANGPHRLIAGDALHLDRYLEPESVDMILTSPPYGNLLKQVKGAFAYKWKEHSRIAPVTNPLPYSDDPQDLGNLPYPEYLTAITEVMAQTVKVMKEDAYAVWVVKDFRASKEKIPFVPFHMHVADCAAQVGLKLWDIQVYDQTKFRPLVCLGYPSKNYYLNIGHSYNMVFRK